MTDSNENAPAASGEQETTNLASVPAAGRAGSHRGWLLALCAAGAAVAGFAVTWMASGPLLPTRQTAVGLSPPAANSPTATIEGQPATRAEVGPAADLPDGLPEHVDAPPETTDLLMQEAKRVANQLTVNFPNSPDAMEVAARLYAQLGRSTEAKKTWQQCIELNPRYAYAYRGLASLAAKEGDYEKAIPLFRRAILLDPTLLITQIDLADTLLNAGRLEEAIALLERNVKRDPQAYRGYVLMGMAYLQQQDYKNAKASYEAALRLDPAHASALFGLATTCRRMGLDAEAERYMQAFRRLRASEIEYRVRDRRTYDDLEARSETLASTYIDAGQVHLARGNLAGAERIWRRASVLNDQDIRPYQALAHIYLRQGNLAKTIDMFTRLLDVDPTNTIARMEIARLYARTGQPEAAEAELKRVCKEVPDEAEGFDALAQLYMQLEGRARDAVAAAEQAVQVEPSAATYALLGGAKNSTGDTAGALEAFKKAADLAPDNLQYLQMYNLLKEQQR